MAKSTKRVTKAPARVNDSMRNLVSKLGTEKDKSSYNEYYLASMTDQQLLTAYRASWIVKKGIKIPAADMTREWRSWQTEKKEIELIEGVEKALNVKRKVKQAIERARLLGGGAIVMGFGDANQEKPIDYNKIKKDGLKYIHVFSRNYFNNDELENDITSPWFGEPKFYKLRITGKADLKIHPSRVVRFLGDEVIDETLVGTQNRGWGDSVLYALDTAVKDALGVSSGISALVQESKIDIFKIPNLMQKIGNPEYENKLMERFTYANMMKSILNAVVMDGNENLERITQNFSALPDVLRMYLLIASGAWDIPATRFLGQSAVGLNSTGDGDLRNYYDRLMSEQKTDLQDTMWRLDQAVIASALGKIPDGIWYLWNPLWAMGEKERADTSKVKAETFQMDWNNQILNEDAMRKIRINQLIEDGDYPGIEEAMEEFPEEVDTDLDEADPEIEEAFNQNREEEDIEVDNDNDPNAKKKAIGDKRRKLKDAKPKSLYVRRDVLNASEIIAWAKSQGFEDIEEAKELHVTIAYSQTPVDWMKAGQAYFGNEKGTLTVAPGGPRMIDEFGEGAVVLLFSSTELQWRHQDIIHMGASWSYPDYQPHITISYKRPVDLNKIEPYRGKIELGPEIFEEVKS